MIHIYAYLKRPESPEAICELEQLVGVRATHLLTDSKGGVLKIIVTPQAYTTYFAKRPESRRLTVPEPLRQYITSMERVEEELRRT